MTIRIPWFTTPARPGVAGRLRELYVGYRPSPSGVLVDGRAITTAADAAAVVVPLLGNESQEVFGVLHLDSKARLLGAQEIARGALAETIVSVRPILAACLGERNSAAVVLFHNHPSGTPDPSPEDIELTRRVVAACTLCEVAVFDHIIVGDRAYCSFVDTGRMSHR